MVDVLEYVNFIKTVEEFKMRAPNKLINYIRNNFENKVLYFFYGNDIKKYNIPSPEIYVIYKNDVDKTQTRPLIQILDLLTIYVMNKVMVVLYTFDEDSILNLSEEIVKLTPNIFELKPK
ncbi:DhNV_093 [Dikerogammarus haemobaphes nudivirus]|nr:DhNV_093 [Dikerogammarus haemobaphes nudivirus]